MSNKNNGLSVVINNQGHISFNADLNFDVEEKEPGSVIHMSDILNTIILQAIKNQVQEALLAPGSFRLVLTGCISNVTGTVQKGEETLDDPQNVEEVIEASGGSEEASSEGEEEVFNEEDAGEPEDEVAEPDLVQDVA